jgi:predicted AAA+ superfamily ATPase
MERNEFEYIQNISRRRVREVPMDLRRFLEKRIDYRDRLISIVGSRGTGKTTLILQHIHETFTDDPDAALYVSMDNLWFNTHSLSEVVDHHYKNGGTHVFIDEIHYLKNWQFVIKNIYDDYPGLNIVYTGSSLLQIDSGSGDLSRRQICYELPGLSFREYLYFEGIAAHESVSLAELLSDHVKIATEYTKDTRILKHFADYLKNRYYPFYREVFAGYDIRLSQITAQILESDYPAVENINYSSVQKIKKMLFILAQSCPRTPVMSELYIQLDTDRNQGLRMLYILEKAKLLNLLSSKAGSLKSMSKPDKIYCDNTNIMYSLTESINEGTKRETFFLNQLRSAGFSVTYPQRGDFLVDDRYLFEVGGPRKSFDQIKDIPDSYLAIDDEEIGRGNKIPLWMFGLLY